MMKVKNLVNNANRAIANQFVITDTERDIQTFQSYDSPIVSIDYRNKVITVYPDYKYSQTTIRNRNIFMGRTPFWQDMADSKGFEYYLNLGAIGNYEIIRSEV